MNKQLRRKPWTEWNDVGMDGPVWSREMGGQNLFGQSMTDDIRRGTNSAAFSLSFRILFLTTSRSDLQ